MTRTTSRTPISQPGATPTPSPARHIWSTPSTTASPPPAPTGAPRLAFSVEALRRPADIRESPKNQRATKDASHHRLAPSWRASSRKRIDSRLDAPEHGWAGRFPHFLDPRVRARSRLYERRKVAYDPPIGRTRRRNRLCGGRARAYVRTSTLSYPLARASLSRSSCGRSSFEAASSCAGCPSRYPSVCL